MSDETQGKAPEAGASAPQAASGSDSGPSSGPGSGPSSGSGSNSGPRSGSRPQGARPSGGPGGRGKFFRRKKVCKFCTEKIDAIPYRDVRLLQGFVAERGKIVPRRLTGVCTTHQRRLTKRHQAGPEYRPAAVCHAALSFGPDFGFPHLFVFALENDSDRTRSGR